MICLSLPGQCRKPPGQHRPSLHHGNKSGTRSNQGQRFPAFWPSQVVNFCDLQFLLSRCQQVLHTHSSSRVIPRSSSSVRLTERQQRGGHLMVNVGLRSQGRTSQYRIGPGLILAGLWTENRGRQSRGGITKVALVCGCRPGRLRFLA